MMSEQLLQSPHCTVIEMGAGKAGLSHSLLSSDEKDLANVEAVVLVDSGHVQRQERRQNETSRSRRVPP